MEFYYYRFAIVWSCWFIFADKSRWRELFPVCFFAGFLGSVSDIITHHYKLWEYDRGQSLVAELADDFGVYLVITYLFIQWLPANRTILKLLTYWLIWTAVTISIEWIHLRTGHLEHHMWWTIWHSYVSDWILLFIFYQYHKIFQFERLSKKT